MSFKFHVEQKTHQVVTLTERILELIRSNAYGKIVPPPGYRI